MGSFLLQNLAVEILIDGMAVVAAVVVEKAVVHIVDSHQRPITKIIKLRRWYKIHPIKPFTTLLLLLLLKRCSGAN